MDAVPADLRHFERPPIDGRREAHDLAGNEPEALGVVLVAALHQDLDTDADAQERLAGRGDVLAQ